ncbi:MAG: hypothetical protein KC657_39940 [Myxococcales bacterium]|nr:hypothetical protein [Myxococcales bacterium]
MEARLNLGLRVARAGAIAALALAGCSSSTTDPAPTAAPKSATQTIGPEGGVINVEGAEVTFPKGAVKAAVAITIEATDEAPPAGFEALSKVIRCEPSGTSFDVPVTMRMTFTPDGKAATMFWSSPEQPAFTDVGGAIDGAKMSAPVKHFSRGFVGRAKPQ